jgi:Zn-finger nucleic acid-binding protein
MFRKKLELSHSNCTSELRFTLRYDAEVDCCPICKGVC